METIRAEDLVLLRNAVRKLTGIDLSYYKENQLRRRLHFIMLRAGAQSVPEYVRLLETDPKVLEDFKNRFAINVSEFFRNPERFEDLRTKVIPEILPGAGALFRIWSAGCSVGSEAYSIAMLLEEMNIRKPYQIWATDIDEDALEEGRRGVYTVQYLQNVPPSYFEKYFEKREDGRFAVVSSLKRRVVFERHDLLQDPVRETFDLVVCRNVVIYFEDRAKDVAFSKLAQALRPGGYLWIGSTERIANPAKFDLRYVMPFFYRKEGKG
ncbi:MAG: protein-glutamate O-methyltransferase CheR [Candidatus Caldatribacterium sp.]|nr:protein-glutamate O-methyltransferase CheR [Candidatus Caldatribacterium sp.]